MHLSHTKQEDTVLPNLHPKSKRSIKTFLSPYHPRQLSKLLTLTPLRSSPTKPPVKPLPEFHFFSQLPSEIRVMIWAIYFTFPRIHITALGSQPTASDPWPLTLSRSPHLHPSLLISHESRSMYQQTCWLETLQRMHIHPQPPVRHPTSASFSSTSFLASPGSDLVNWDTDIFWFRGISTVKKLSIGYPESHLQRYEDVRKVALDYAVLDYEEDSYYWRKRFKVGWYGLVCVLYLFEFLEEVYFVLDVEGGEGVGKGDTEVSFEMVDAEERVRRRLEDVKREVDRDDGLRFPQLDDRGMYPGLERLFSRRERGYGWQIPKIRFVYARNIG
ncbi:uncharacterized protein EAF02_000703 [Botrytis sinoallii]|uniref:uncharacterized protein n=1 Tax=Botrytis sinoallii TaxID=1463999 RepID=UPI0019025062|nr:uncharacterized protein EAF02_000703 [Botrytis sinoallii]KAF7893165.1 hypothetical protein EAF02_000703 [Botrytis sinoallii]